MVHIKEQDFDETCDYIELGDAVFVNSKKVQRLMLGFANKLIHEGKLTVTPGHEAYFKALEHVE